MASVTLCLDLLHEVELWIDAWNERTTERRESKYWTVTAIPNKGYGMVSKTDIKAHTTILIEKAILFERKRKSDSDPPNCKPVHQLLLEDFNKLPLNEQGIVMRLANAFEDDEKRNAIEAIYDTSAVQTNASNLHTSGLFATFARINHSCIPNCTMYFKSFPAEALVVQTLFDIEQNTQLTVSYLPRFKITYAERQKLLKTRYKFRCDCSLCDEETKHDAEIKEYRLALMNGNQHWNCIQTAMEILDKHFKSAPTIKTNLLSSAIDCATQHYMYHDAYNLIVESIELNIKCFGLHCKRWKELYQQIIRLKSYSHDDERCDQLLDTYQCLWNQ